jgi:MOSC domain-containing protein YiiM
VARGARVVAVALSQEHGFSKQPRGVVRLVEGLGVEGDAHAGTTVQHLSRVRRDPTEPNLRQVHLIASELFEEVAAAGFDVLPGQLGENVTTAGVDLLALPVGTTLMLGGTAEVVLTGLRNPCRQINAFRPGLLPQVLGRDADGSVVRRAGVMGVVRHGGEVRPGDAVTVVLPEEPHEPLRTV